MQQVLDYFKLLDKAVTAHGGKSVGIVWQLLSASTNSPFAIEATAVSAIPGKSVEAEAIVSASLLAEGLNQIVPVQGAGLLTANFSPVELLTEA